MSDEWSLAISYHSLLTDSLLTLSWPMLPAKRNMANPIEVGHVLLTTVKEHQFALGATAFFDSFSHTALRALLKQAGSRASAWTAKLVALAMLPSAHASQ